MWSLLTNSWNLLTPGSNITPATVGNKSHIKSRFNLCWNFLLAKLKLGLWGKSLKKIYMQSQKFWKRSHIEIQNDFSNRFYLSDRDSSWDMDCFSLHFNDNYYIENLIKSYDRLFWKILFQNFFSRIFS